MCTISLMSAPAANALSPAPVSTTTRASESVASSPEPVAQLRERLAVQRVQRVGPVDGDDGDAVVALLDLNRYAATFDRRNSTISPVGAPGVKTAATPLLLQLLGVLGRNRPAEHDQHVLGTVLAQPVEDARDERHVRAREDRDADRVRVLLDRGLDDLLRCLVEAGVDHLHTRVAERPGDDLGAAVVSVEAGLGDDHANPLPHQGGSIRRWPFLSRPGGRRAGTHLPRRSPESRYAAARRRRHLRCRPRRRRPRMKLTVVGCSPAWPNPGGAQSGYLVEGSGRLLLDCGPGVLSQAAPARGLAADRLDRDLPLAPRPLGRPRPLGVGQHVRPRPGCRRSRSSGFRPDGTDLLPDVRRADGHADDVLERVRDRGVRGGEPFDTAAGPDDHADQGPALHAADLRLPGHER